MLGFTSASGQGSPLLGHKGPPHLARAYRAPAWTSSLRLLTTAWFIAGVTPHLEVTKSCVLSPGAGAAGELGRPGRQGKRRPGQILNLDHGLVEG